MFDQLTRDNQIECRADDFSQPRHGNVGDVNVISLFGEGSNALFYDVYSYAFRRHLHESSVQVRRMRISLTEVIHDANVEHSFSTRQFGQIWVAIVDRRSMRFNEL